MYNTIYSPQASIDRINNQIAELEKMKSQIPIQAPITQNFQFGNNGMKYVESINEVEKIFVIGDTPFFSKDMSVVWIKNANGEIKTYTLAEIIQKDEKDMLIESLKMQLEEIKGEKYGKSNITDVDEPVENKKPNNVSTNKFFKTK